MQLEAEADVMQVPYRSAHAGFVSSVDAEKSLKVEEQLKALKSKMNGPAVTKSETK